MSGIGLIGLGAGTDYMAAAAPTYLPMPDVSTLPNARHALTAHELCSDKLASITVTPVTPPRAPLRVASLVSLDGGFGATRRAASGSLELDLAPAASSELIMCELEEPRLNGLRELGAAGLLQLHAARCPQPPPRRDAAAALLAGGAPAVAAAAGGAAAGSAPLGALLLREVAGGAAARTDEQLLVLEAPVLGGPRFFDTLSDTLGLGSTLLAAPPQSMDGSELMRGRKPLGELCAAVPQWSSSLEDSGFSVESVLGKLGLAAQDASPMLEVEEPLLEWRSRATVISIPDVVRDSSAAQLSITSMKIREAPTSAHALNQKQNISGLVRSLVARDMQSAQCGGELVLHEPELPNLRSRSADKDYINTAKLVLSLKTRAIASLEIHPSIAGAMSCTTGGVSGFSIQGFAEELLTASPIAPAAALEQEQEQEQEQEHEQEQQSPALAVGTILSTSASKPAAKQREQRKPNDGYGTLPSPAAPSRFSASSVRKRVRGQGHGEDTISTPTSTTPSKARPTGSERRTAYSSSMTKQRQPSSVLAVPAGAVASKKRQQPAESTSSLDQFMMARGVGPFPKRNRHGLLEPPPNSSVGAAELDLATQIDRSSVARTFVIAPPKLEDNVVSLLVYQQLENGSRKTLVICEAGAPLMTAHARQRFSQQRFAGEEKLAPQVMLVLAYKDLRQAIKEADVLFVDAASLIKAVKHDGHLTGLLRSKVGCVLILGHDSARIVASCAPLQKYFFVGQPQTPSMRTPPVAGFGSGPTSSSGSADVKVVVLVGGNGNCLVQPFKDYTRLCGIQEIICRSSEVLADSGTSRCFVNAQIPAAAVPFMRTLMKRAVSVTQELVAGDWISPASVGNAAESLGSAFLSSDVRRLFDLSKTKLMESRGGDPQETTRVSNAVRSLGTLHTLLYCLELCKNHSFTVAHAFMLGVMQDTGYVKLLQDRCDQVYSELQALMVTISKQEDSIKLPCLLASLQGERQRCGDAFRALVLVDSDVNEVLGFVRQTFRACLHGDDESSFDVTVGNIQELAAIEKSTSSQHSTVIALNESIADQMRLEQSPLVDSSRYLVIQCSGVKRSNLLSDQLHDTAVARLRQGSCDPKSLQPSKALTGSNARFSTEDLFSGSEARKAQPARAQPSNARAKQPASQPVVVTSSRSVPQMMAPPRPQPAECAAPAPALPVLSGIARRSTIIVGDGSGGLLRRNGILTALEHAGMCLVERRVAGDIDLIIDEITAVLIVAAEDFAIHFEEQKVESAQEKQEQKVFFAAFVDGLQQASYAYSKVYVLVEKQKTTRSNKGAQRASALVKRVQQDVTATGSDLDPCKFALQWAVNGGEAAVASKLVQIINEVATDFMKSGGQLERWEAEDRVMDIHAEEEQFLTKAECLNIYAAQTLLSELPLRDILYGDPRQIQGVLSSPSLPLSRLVTMQEILQPLLAAAPAEDDGGTAAGEEYSPLGGCSSHHSGYEYDQHSNELRRTI